MTKLNSVFVASGLALSLSGMMILTADENTQDQTAAPKTQDQGAPPADLSKQDLEYFVALRNCEDLQDAARQKCIEQARQKYNRM
jgi:hypothetical protein